MTPFGWFTVALWIYAGFNSDQAVAKLLCVLMIVGTVVWGTGSL